MKITQSALLFLLFISSSVAVAQEKPNIVLVFLDNFGWGEPGFNGGGIIRGTAAPRLDQLAAEGLRLTNFNVEVQCTPSRSAILTGRYAIRTEITHTHAEKLPTWPYPPTTYTGIYPYAFTVNIPFAGTDA
jgi:arylsulfatase A-like enzyme